MTDRQKMKTTLREIVEGNGPNSIPQHVLIAGMEGAGKSYIIAELQQDLAQSGYSVAKFIYPHCNIVNADYIINKVEDHENERYIILIDDFDKMLMSLPNDEQYRLRAFLFKKNAPTLIATSTGLYEGFSDYRAPFYDAFRVLHIPQLQKDDLAGLLPADTYTKVKDDKEYNDLLPKLAGNLNYILSLADALCENKGMNESLDAVVKANERYFRCLFGSLPGVQQRALYGLACSGETATSSDVQQTSGLSAANTASALFRLEKQSFIMRVGAQKRNVTYQIKDYLLWMWLGKYRCLIHHTMGREMPQIF